jgi:hypothetical protein
VQVCVKGKKRVMIFTQMGESAAGSGREEGEMLCMDMTMRCDAMQIVAYVRLSHRTSQPRAR